MAGDSRCGEGATEGQRDSVNVCDPTHAHTAPDAGRVNHPPFRPRSRLLLFDRSSSPPERDAPLCSPHTTFI